MERIQERETEGRILNQRGRGRGGRGRGTTRDRSPGQQREIRGIQRRLDGGDLGSIFGSISKVMNREMEAVVGNTPRDIKAAMKEGMSLVVKAVEDAMIMIAEKVGREGEERKERERMMQEQLDKLEEKVMGLEKKAEVGQVQIENRVKLSEEKAEAGRTQIENRVKRLEERQGGGQEKVKNIEEQMGLVKEKVRSVTEMALRIQVSESVKDMEERVSEARCGVKVVNMDLGQVTDNKALIVRKVLEEVRKRVKQEEAGQVNSVLRRTRVVLLAGGQRVGRWEGGLWLQYQSSSNVWTPRTCRYWKGG